MATTVSVDPRFQIPDSLPTSDPSHPLNLVRTINEVQNQAAADSQYDIPTPDRFKQGGGSSKKEGFRSPFHGPSDYILVLGILMLLGIVWLYVKDSMRTLYILVLMLMFGILFLIHKKAFDS